MPAGAITHYRANIDDKRLRDLPSATVKLMLVGSAYTPDTTPTGHSLKAQITNEIAAGNGYTAGGIALANGAVIEIVNGWGFETDDAVWNAAGGNIPAWHYGVLYVEGTLWGMTNPLLGLFVGDTTPADIPQTLDGNPLTISCPANGWIADTQA